MEKTGPYTEEMAAAAAETSREFRERHVEIVEKSRNEEIKALLCSGRREQGDEDEGSDEADGESIRDNGDGSERGLKDGLRTYRAKWC